MAVALSVLATRMTATAAAVATALASGTTQAEVEALAKILDTAAKDPGMTVQIAKKSGDVRQVLIQ